MEYYVEVEGIPGGPSSLAELSGWPTCMVQEYFHFDQSTAAHLDGNAAGASRLHRLCSLLEHGLVVHSD